MKKVIAFLILGIIVLSIVIVFQTKERISDYEKEKLEKGIGEGESQELPQIKPGASTDKKKTNETGTTGGIAGGGATGENKTLPSDIETRPCGFYFGEYEVCAGACPSGSCIQEGRSCYCREV